MSCEKRATTGGRLVAFFEAFINFYGVVRLGEKQFHRHVERLPIHPLSWGPR